LSGCSSYPFGSAGVEVIAMVERSGAGKPAEITFTCDFHELVGGELRPGGSVLLRYDPLRIVPAEEPYRFGDPDRPVTAHVRFRAGATPMQVPLHSPAGLVPCPDVDPTGQGSMLSAHIDVPDDAERLTVWFSYTGASGETHYDSDFGVNYRFGFPCREIEVIRATVTRRPDQPADWFELSIRAAATVEGMAVPFFLVADPACAKHQLLLRRIGQPTEASGGNGLTSLWNAAIEVARGAVVRFKVCYWIGGRRLTDDNTGAWYLAPEPEPDRIPPPPPALLEAAAAWR
jgi:Family of unknown function (DUF6209)